MKPNTTNSQSVESTVGGANRPPRIPTGHWLGVLPFFVFSGLFLIGPTLILAYRSLEGPKGGLTLDNYRQLMSDTVMSAYGMSIKISLTTAILGGLIGFLMAWVVSMGWLPSRLRLITTTEQRKTNPKYSQVRFAAQVGLSVSYINDLLHGRTTCGRGGALRIAQGTDGQVDLAELVSWEPQRSGDAA